MNIKVIVGLILIVASFIFLLRNPSRSMIDNMRDNSLKKMKDTLAGSGQQDGTADSAGIAGGGERTEPHTAETADKAIQEPDISGKNDIA